MIDLPFPRLHSVLTFGLMLVTHVSFAPAAERYALLVGINQYDHPKLRDPPLKFAVNDATEMADVLAKAGYRVTLLTDDAGRKDAKLAPNKSNVAQQLADVLRRTKRGDTVLVGLAGHGLQFGKDAYFCPQDARPFADEAATLLPLSKVYDEMEKSFADVKVLLVDACRNDPTPGRGRGVDGDNAPRPPRGVGALFSCSAGQRAFEHDDLKHGVFFHYVLEGLKKEAADRDGDVTFDDLQKYVRKRVPLKVRELFPDQRPDQFPNVKADLMGEPPVLAKVSVKTTPATVPTPARAPSWDAGKLTARVKSESAPLQQGEETRRMARRGERFTVGQTNGPWMWLVPQNDGDPSGWMQAEHLEFEPTVVTGGLELKLIWCPQGRFMMGSPKSEADRAEEEEDQVEAIHTRGFWLAAHEVTQAQWEKMMGNNPGWFTPKGGGATAVAGLNTPGFPVDNVDWYSARTFCRKLTDQERRDGRLSKDWEYTLPTEAQWEYACRAGTTTAFHFGNDEKDLGEYDWFVLNADGRPHEVGKKKPNRWGFYDMHGNVDEVCRDFGRKKLPGGDDPEVTDDKEFVTHVDRGGHWGARQGCRSAARLLNGGGGGTTQGVRVAVVQVKK